MKEGTVVYTTKHYHRQFSTKPYRYEVTREVGTQYNFETDNVCACRNVTGVKRHQEVRYFSNLPRHVYAYHGVRSYTDVGLGNVKALQKKKIKKIYLPETDDRGVGSSELTSYYTGKTRPYKENYKYINNNINTSTRGVGGAVNDKIKVIHEKLSPIITNTKSGSTSPDISSGENQRKNVEIGSNTLDKALASISTQIDESTDFHDVKIEVRTVELSVEHDKEIAKHKKSSQKISATPGDGNGREKRISKRAQEAEQVFSSDSLVEHVYNLENPSEDRQSHVDMMENKLEREYRRMFSLKSKESKEKRIEEERTSSSMKSTSLLRRRFEALRRGLAKKEDTKRNEKIADKYYSNGSELSKRDVSIASDPPSLESRSYSDMKVRSPYPNTIQYTPKRVYIKPSAVPQNSRNIDAAEDDISSYQDATGMFKLWGKKFNLDDEIAQTSKSNKTNENISNKKERKRFFFFKKKTKDKPQEMYKQKKGVTAGRCEVGDGLMIKIGAADPKHNRSENKESRKVIDTIPEEYEDVFRKAWLQKFLAQTIESRNSVKVRWNNNAYATSSSTIFEIMENVYKDTGIIFRSKSEIATKESSYYKSNQKQRVNFDQDIEAWMIPELVPCKNTSKSHQEEKNKNNIQVRISDQKWIIEKSKAFAHKIEVVLHSRNIVTSHRNHGTEYLKIDIPKGFFSDSDTESVGHEHTSNEEVFKIVEYETPESTSRVNAGDFEIGDYLKDVKVTVSVKNSRKFESKIIETVIKRPEIRRDVVIQGSTVYIPKRCNVIGVGIITQKDTRIQKSMLEIQDEYTDDESDHSINKSHNKRRFADSYLQEYYRHWTPLGVDCFSWCISDSHIQACSDISQDTVTNQGDGTRSCPNIYDEYIATVISSCGTSCCNPCGPDMCENEKPTNIVTKFYNKLKPILRSEQHQVLEKRVLPKDSLEVFKKRKLYALSAKSQWACSDDKPYSIPSMESRGDQGTLIDCPKVKKTCWKPTPRTQKTKTCEKHVSLPDSETLNTSLAKQLDTTNPSGILTFKGSVKCEVCEKKGSLCSKHATVNPIPVCEIAPPNRPCLDDSPPACKPSARCSGGMIMPIRDTISHTSISIQPKCDSPIPTSQFPPHPCPLPPKTCFSPSSFPPTHHPPSPCLPPPQCGHPSNPCHSPPMPCHPAPKPCPPPLIPRQVPPPTCHNRPCHPFSTPLVSSSEACPPPKSSKQCSFHLEPCENSPEPCPPKPQKPCERTTALCPPKPPESYRTSLKPCSKPKLKKPTEITPQSTPTKQNTSRPCSYPKNETPAQPCSSDKPKKCWSPGRPPCGSPPVSGIHLRSPPRSRSGSPTPKESPPKSKKHSCPITVTSSSSSNASPSCSPKTSYIKPPMQPCPEPPLYDSTASSSASSCDEKHRCLEKSTPPTPPPSKNIRIRFDKPNACTHIPPCKNKSTKNSPRSSPKLSCEKPSTESCNSKYSPKRKKKNPKSSTSSRCQSPKSKRPPDKSKYSPKEPTSLSKNSVCPTLKNPPCSACCKKSCSQVFPWPLKNQNSNQDSVQNSQSDYTGTKETNTKNNDTVDKQTGEGCGRIPVKCPSKPSCKSPPKVSGIFLKLKPEKKCSNKCNTTKQNASVPKRPALRSSEDDIIINIKKGTDSTEEIREGLNIKVQDFDGKTLFERRDYTTNIEKENKRKRPSVLNDMYKNSNVHVVSTSRQVQNMQCNEDSNIDLVDAKSEASVANLIEINFKLKVTQGDKTTELKIDKDDVSDKPKHVTRNQIGQTSQAFFMLKDEAEQSTEESNDKNDINIKIIIKNYKPKIKNKHLCDEFVQNITEKSQSVSTGYSDVLSPKNEDDNVYSVHRTTVNVVSSNEGPKADIQNTNTDLSDKFIGRLSKQASDCVSNKLTTNHSGNKANKDKTELDCLSNENEAKDIDKYNYKEEKREGAKQTNYSLMTEMEVKDSVKETDKPNAINSFHDKISKSLTREEKKSILKKILEKVRKTNKKEKMKQFTDVLNMILTDNNDLDDITQKSDDLLEELTYNSHGPNYFKDTDSMNNYYTFESSAASTQEKDENYNVKYPTYNPSESSVRDTEESCDDAKSGTCLCSAFAARLDLEDEGGCCCRYPRKADGETNCDLRTEDDFLLLNYKTIEYIDVETQNSKYFCNANKLSVHSKAVSSCFNKNNETTLEIIENSETLKPFYRKDFAHVTNRQSCQYKKLNKNTMLGISDEDKVYFLNTKPTNVALATISRDVTKNVLYAKYEQIADVLQSNETKKAVLEIYTERAVSDVGTCLVAKLPKFVPDKETDIERNYEEYVQNLYEDIRKRVMMCVKR